MNSGKRRKLPLYARVENQLTERIRSGQWKPGQVIPSEFQIAAELRVSQGTARRAVQGLSEKKLVVRRQGSGTFVFEHTSSDILFRFFNLFDDSGARIIPHNRSIRCVVAKANLAERKALGLRRNAQVFRIDRLRARTRTRSRKPFITESVTLPEEVFPGLASLPEAPDSFYDVFQKRYGVLVTRTEERIRAVAADAKAAGELGVAVGTPVLRIERITCTLDDMPVELRVSLCHLEHGHFLARTK